MHRMNDQDDCLSSSWMARLARIAVDWMPQDGRRMAGLRDVKPWGSVQLQGMTKVAALYVDHSLSFLSWTPVDWDEDLCCSSLR